MVDKFILKPMIEKSKYGQVSFKRVAGGGMAAGSPVLNGLRRAGRTIVVPDGIFTC
jgi:hypothetical protein